MSDFIFTRETVLKKELYARIKSILTEAGWQNISSRPSTDFDVFYSEGESGDRGLYFNMKEFGTSTTSSMSTSSSSTIYFRLIKGYTPSQTVGSAGTFERNDSWRGVNLMSSLAIEHKVTFYYHCNLNRLILFTEFPASYPIGNHHSCYFSIGVPDVTFGVKGPKQDLILASSYWDSTNNGNIYITDQVDSPRTSAYSLTTYDMFSSFPNDGKSLSIANKLFFSEVAYGSTSEGTRGILDGIYTLKEPNAVVNSNYFYLATIKQGDEFVDEEGKRYRILVGQGTLSYSSLGSKYYAFRIG